MNIKNQLDNRLADLDKEAQIISHIINKKEDQLIIIDELKPHHFSDAHLEEIYYYIFNRYLEGKEITKQSIASEIQLSAKPSRQKDIIDVYNSLIHLELQDTIGNTIGHLKDLYKNRIIYNEIIIKTNREFISNEPIDAIIRNISDALLNIESGRKEVDLKSTTQSVVDSILHPDKDEQGLKTGIRELDTIYGGFKKDTVWVIGGESGSGKTATVTDLIYRICTRHKDKVAVLFYSYEMSEKRIVKRLVSRITGLSNQRLDRIGRILDKDEMIDIHEAGSQIESFPLTIVYDTLDITRLKLRTRKFALQNKGKHLIIFLDHIGLIDGNNENIRINTIEASATMKSFCRDFNATSVVLTQLRKDLASKENRKNFHIPDASYIMESGSIKADADNLLLLWRPEMRWNGKDEQGNDVMIPYNGPGSTERGMWSPKNKLVMINDKNRDGIADTHIVLDCDIKSNKLGNLENDEF